MKKKCDRSAKEEEADEDQLHRHLAPRRCVPVVCDRSLDDYFLS